MNTVPRTRAPFPLPTGAGFGIALGLAAVSYGHILHFAEGAGGELWEAIIIAATVDGLIVMALAVIGHARRHGVKPPKIAKVALLTGVVATGGANLHHGLSYGWEGVAMAVWVPLVAELAYLLAMSALRISQEAAVRRPVICGHLVSVATLAATMPATPDTPPIPDDPASLFPTEDFPVDLGARERAVAAWLSGPDAPDRITGQDVSDWLATSGRGQVTERTGRRILKDVRAALSAGHRGDRPLAAVAAG